MTEKPVKSVTDMEFGETAVVREFSAGHGVARKLLVMGIVPGRAIRKISGGRHGPVVVESSGVSIALGASLAAKILVELEPG
ncbi:MAG: FeoA domain-containing protein [Elusimicrobiaceae bacterium]|nr:FeoA domain-containing protein [Elusimicrobiaceae bacterium]